MTIEEKKALQKLGEAFATIEEYRDYLPAGIYNAVGEALNETLHNRSQWLSNPDLLRQIFPIIAEHLRAQEAAGESEPETERERVTLH